MESYGRRLSIAADSTDAQRAHLTELRHKLEERKKAGEDSVTIRYIRGIPAIVSISQKN